MKSRNLAVTAFTLAATAIPGMKSISSLSSRAAPAAACCST